VGFRCSTKWRTPSRKSADFSGPQNRFLELDLHARGPRVELLGPIERDRRDPVGDPQQHGFFHGVLLSSGIVAEIAAAGISIFGILI
jgi:hypothetical protein